MKIIQWNIFGEMEEVYPPPLIKKLPGRKAPGRVLEVL